jgi:class 3 adenylate cyclase
MPDERKLVTILFADTIGSTALGESLDPEDLRILMGRYYEHARRVVADYGGTVEKFIGDAVMAVFGLPQAHGDDAERALAAALALRTAIATDDLLGGRLVLRIGVNTGNVMAAPADAKRGDFLVTGDAVNVAARLEQSASTDEILVSERTAMAAEAAFLFAEGRTIIVKGKSQPLPVFPLTSERPARQRYQSPLVGRKSDLAQLLLLRDRALIERRPQLVSLVAPSGTGKTRLLDEFLTRRDPQDDSRVATAHCLPYGQTLTYWPLRGMLEELLGITFTPESIVRTFTAGGLSQDDAVRLSGLVLATLGVEREDVVERDAIWSAWRLLFEVLAAQAPRIVVFEDLHCASESLLDLIEYVMQPHTHAPLLIVATSRPELLDRRPSWGNGLHGITVLRLAPLSAVQSRTLVNKLTKRLPEATRDQIIERSGGNPFFIIELTRALADRRPAAQSAAGTPRSQPETLPDTVQEALQERLDLLSPRERTVLQAASVAGRQFHAAMLQAMLESAEPGEIDLALDGLLARDLIVRVGVGDYAFRHLLIREAAYGTLSRAERIRLHTAVAAWLEEFAAGRLDEFVELIAFHAREAALLARQAAVPVDLTVVTPRAVRFLKRAGEVASRASAYAESENYLRSAIELAPEAEHLGLYEVLGDCLIMGDASLAAYQRALEAWRSGAARQSLVGARLSRKLLTVLMRWWGSLTERPSREEMAALLSEARTLAEAAGDDYEWWRLRTVELFWPTWSGENVAEEGLVQMAIGLEAAAYFEARRDWTAFNEALDAYTECASDLGMYVAAAEACRRRLSIPGLSINERCDVLAMLVRGQTEAGDYTGALETMRTAIAGRRSGDPSAPLGHAASWASFAAYLAGCWPEVADFVSMVDEAWEESGRDPGYVTLQWSYAVALQVALAREDQTATQRAAEALERLAGGTAKHRSRWLLALVEASLRDDPAPLQQDAWSITGLDQYWAVHAPIVMFLSERGLPLPHTLRDLFAPGLQMRYIDYLHRCIQIAEALAAPDDENLAAAIQEAEVHNLIPHAARMRIVLAERSGDLTQLERARPVLERLGDRQFLRRLQDTAAALQ